MKPISVAALLVVLAGTAHGQEDLVIDQTRLYVSDPAACQALDERGVDAWMEMDFLTLSFERGIQSMEYHCNFYDVKGRKGGNHLFIDAICELPGEIYPDILAVTPWSETEIQVVSNADITLAMSGAMEGAIPAETEEPVVPGATIYTRCDNLSEIPVD
jgi:hypothetical protein